MRGIPNFNFPAFDAARDKLIADGWDVISPADIDRLHEGWGEFPPPEIEGDLNRFIRRDIEVIFNLDPDADDAIIVLPGFERSRGVAVELSVALFCGLDIIRLEDAGSWDCGNA